MRRQLTEDNESIRDQVVDEVLTAEEKAWEFLRKTINDDIKFDLLRSGHPIDVMGNLGGRYIMYPRGQIVRLDDEFARMGEIHPSRKMPYPDVLATIYTWITTDEELFKKKWACGNLYIEDDVEAENEVIGQDIVAHYRHHGIGGFTSLLMKVLPVLMVGIIGVVVMPTLVSSMQTTMNATANNSTFFHLSDTLGSFIGLFPMLFMAVCLLSIIMWFIKRD